MLAKLNDWQHTLIALAVIGCVTALNLNGQCDSVQTITVMLAAAGISGSGIVAGKAVTGVANSTPVVGGSGAGDGGDPTVAPQA